MTTLLTHLIYTSVATRQPATHELVELLRRARENNERAGLTGMLLYADGNFFQVLEGEAKTIDLLFSRIERDDRHGHVTRIICEPIPERSFDAWTMGFCSVSKDELAGIAGVNDFFRQGQSQLGLDAGRARKLLDAFREGRWRRKLAGGRSVASA